ncbi:LysR family substrate-binding domain-containing protein [Glaciibacter sp. 2TAF33]|uniref:LysR family substrate-binding domain-containing protein n=1 Tax=Glaciibacter sp. 2TAF33 TaxID=3233015 RepID=UPI003F914147
MPFSLGFIAGVTPTKWTRLWAERRPEVPLEVFPTEPGEQTAVLRDGRATVSLVRLPIDDDGLSVIPLYREIPVVVVAADHEIAGLPDDAVVPLSGLADEHLMQDPDDVPEWRDLSTEVQDGTRRPLPTMRDLDDVMEQIAAGVGIAILPHSLARLHSRKDVASRPVDGVAETQIALAWLKAETTDDVEEFVGIVRGRRAGSSRAATVVVRGEPEKKVKKTAKAKEAAKLAREAAAKSKPQQARKKPTAPGRTRTAAPPKGKRRGSR